jgi:diguanylate cyclase (GGDEF)-like protein
MTRIVAHCDGLETMLNPVDPSESQMDAELVRTLQETQRDLDMLVRGGRWLVWACKLTWRAGSDDEWIWEFRPDISPVMPDWFDIVLPEGEHLAEALWRSRLPEDRAHLDDTCKTAIMTGNPGYTQMFRVRLCDGRISWIEENVSIQKLDDGHWRLVGICIDATKRMADEERLHQLQDELVGKQSVLLAQNQELQELRNTLERDTIALARANLRLESLATTDGLIGIKNHRAFQEQLEKDWSAAKRYNLSLALVMLDIDHFKPFNDEFGHPAGDEVLKQVGAILQSSVRPCDCLARYGGEEFVIILTETDQTDAEAMAEQLRRNIESHAWDRRPITVSVGVSWRCPRHTNAQMLLVDADRALYAAKAGGRNRVRCPEWSQADKAA